MESLVTLLMIAVCLCFMLKLTWHTDRSVFIHALLLGLFAGLIWPVAIGQSTSQISTWLSDTALMQDTAVLLTVEIILQIAFCLLALHVATSGKLKRRTIVFYRILRWFPGFLILAVVFSIEVFLILNLPGVPFAAIAWSLGGAILIFVPLITLLLKKLIPEKSLRTELLFLANLLIALLGIVATVNGITSVEGFGSVDLSSLLGILLLTAAGALIGRWTCKFRKY